MKIKIEIDVLKIIHITENHGGYKVGECFLCNASGWLEGKFGHPYGTKGTGADLKHKKSCPMNRVIERN